MESSGAPRARNFNVRLTDEEFALLRNLADLHGDKTPSALVRRWIEAERSQLATETRVEKQNEVLFDTPKIVWRGKRGRIYHGDSRGLMLNALDEHSVDLVVTSPPFALRSKKSYGNEDAHAYLEWFRPFAKGIKRVLKPTGSLVIDIGPAWLEGIPAKSLYQFELLIMLCEEFGFYLAQDFYWWNPSRMPAPAEWVNIRRLRAKDAVTPVWWLSPTPWPKASNRRVLTAYGKAQKTLFNRGYNSGARPSGHVVSKVWGRDNGGAIPPNIIAVPNTISEDPYQRYCRDNGIKPHPARFPWALPEFFVRMLTDKGDVVLDPFAGSCITGAVADAAERKWLCCEIQHEYLQGAMSRFSSEYRVTKGPPVNESGYNVPTTLPYDSGDEIAIDCYGGRPPPHR